MVTIKWILRKSVGSARTIMIWPTTRTRGRLL